MILIGRHMIGAARRHPFIHELGCPAGEFRAVDQDTNLGIDGARTRIEVETPDGNRLTIEYHNLGTVTMRVICLQGSTTAASRWRLPSSTRENSDWAGCRSAASWKSAPMVVVCGSRRAVEEVRGYSQLIVVPHAIRRNTSTREDINLRSGLARWALIDVHLAPSRMAMARFPRSIGSPSSMIVVGVLRNTTLIPSDVSDPFHSHGSEGRRAVLSRPPSLIDARNLSAEGTHCKMISTRRLAGSRVLGAVGTAGSASPRPETVICSAGMPFLIRYSRTASARFNESFWL
jgi:hypothetical protein